METPLTTMAKAFEETSALFGTHKEAGCFAAAADTSEHNGMECELEDGGTRGPRATCRRCRELLCPGTAGSN
jgi:hypothetical protein